MYRLPKHKRVQMLSMLVEGSSMRSTARVCDVSVNAVCRLLDVAGKACQLYHDQHVRGIKGKRNVQCDEVWSFVYAKDRSLEWADPWDTAGSIWTFTALDADSKLLIAYTLKRRRSTRSATVVFRDLASRLKKRPKLTADALKAYSIAAHKVWGKKADLSQVRKGEDTDHSTSYVERHNLTIRMANRRFARKTNAFSKKLSRHEAAMHLFAVYYNFCRIHGTLRVSPAMEAGIDDKLHDVGWIVDLIDEITRPPKKPGPKKGTKYRPRKTVK